MSDERIFREQSPTESIEPEIAANERRAAGEDSGEAQDGLAGTVAAIASSFARPLAETAFEEDDEGGRRRRQNDADQR